MKRSSMYKLLSFDVYGTLIRIGIPPASRRCDRRVEARAGSARERARHTPSHPTRSPISTNSAGTRPGRRQCRLGDQSTGRGELCSRVCGGRRARKAICTVLSSPTTVIGLSRSRRTFVQMPLVADARGPATDSVGERLAKFARPLPHRFVANSDATSGQQLLDHSQPEREPEIQPDGVADDLAREPITGIASASRCHHATRLPIPVRYRKPAGC